MPRTEDLLPKTPELIGKSPDITVSFSIPEIPEINYGADIGVIIYEKMQLLGSIMDNDILVIASKIISKAEGRIIDVSQIEPSEEAYRLYELLDRKSPKIIELILSEAKDYKIENGVIIAKHRLGFVLTSAGVDGKGKDTAIILPEDPDDSAKKIMNRIEELSGRKVAIIISDSEGRVDRAGTNSLSIGVAGIEPLRINEVLDESGKVKKTEETICDMLAAQAGLLMGQRGNNLPVVCIRGFKYEHNPNANLQSIIHK